MLICPLFPVYHFLLISHLWSRLVFLQIIFSLPFHLLLEPYPSNIYCCFFFLISFHWHYPLVLSLHPCILLSTYPILIYDDKSVRFTKSSALDSHIQQKHNIIFSMENFTLDVQSILLKDIFKVLLNWKISKFKLRGKHWSEHRKDNRSKIIGQRAKVVLIPEPDSEHWK